MSYDLFILIIDSKEKCPILTHNTQTKYGKSKQPSTHSTQTRTREVEKPPHRLPNCLWSVSLFHFRVALPSIGHHLIHKLTITIGNRAINVILQTDGVPCPFVCKYIPPIFLVMEVFPVLTDGLYYALQAVFYLGIYHHPYHA